MSILPWSELAPIRNLTQRLFALTFKMLETPSPEYAERTEWNVRDSDATVIFTITPHLSEGSDLTRHFAEHYNKPYLHIHQGHTRPATLLLNFLRQHSINVLNIAGPRASTEPEVGHFVEEVLDEALG